MILPKISYLIQILAMSLYALFLTGAITVFLTTKDMFEGVKNQNILGKKSMLPLN